MRQRERETETERKKDKRDRVTNTEVGGLRLSVCLSVSVSVCLSVFPSLSIECAHERETFIKEEQRLLTYDTPSNSTGTKDVSFVLMVRKSMIFVKSYAIEKKFGKDLTTCK